MLCHSLTDRLQPWLRDYDRLQSFAVILIYIQIGCSLIGSLGALYTGILLINLAISLFALVAIESSSQSLGRTYAVLLLSSLILDISWFFLFSSDIWNISSEKYGAYFIFSVKLTLSMQIIGFSLRLSSSLLWIQIYRMGASHLDTTIPTDTDYDLRSSFLSPATPAVARHSSGSDEVLGGSIYDPAYYSSLFEDSQENRLSVMVQNHPIGGNGSTSAADVSPLKLSMSRSYHSVDGQNHSISGSLSTSADASPLKPSLGRSFQSIDEENTSGQPQPFRV
ncbi:uncharacterized protein LOC133781379 [Humulus lupulus]|uniref:uncharacterized protein LOC133781379 n=1 Tax=Humulus lupulus TaxID=3486 RepID=UPI002B4179FC|nr:uncharacterized protein LOC133781379 [Humulus lupulus]